MKKAVLALASMIALFLSFSLVCAALPEERGVASEYRVSMSEGDYLLSDEEGWERFETLGELLVSLEGGASLYFDAVKAEESLSLPRGGFVLSGSLELSGKLEIGEGTSLSISDISLSAKGGICVRGSLSLSGGRICAECDEGISVYEGGECRMLGGSVENSGGAAIVCRGSLSLSGSPAVKGSGYDIISGGRVSLCESTKGFVSAEPVSLKLLSEFGAGSFSVVFEDASEASLQSLRPFDKDGREISAQFFESSPYTEKKNFLGIFLPLKIKIISKYTSSELYSLKGDILPRPTPEALAGYRHVGYYMDEEMTESFLFDTPILSDTVIYSRYELIEPSFSLSSMDITYDKKSHALSATGLSHPLEKLGGFFSYAWYKDGELISNARSIELRDVCDSGRYRLEISFSYLSDRSGASAESADIRIRKMKLSLPRLEAVEYTGRPISPPIPPSSKYTFKKEEYTNAGEYKIALFVLDKENTEWEGGGDTAETVFKISKAKNKFFEGVSVENVYFGCQIEPISLSKFGEPVYYYSKTENGEYTKLPPSAIGEYYVKAVVSESENHKGAVSGPVRFSIMEDTPVSIFLESLPERTSYTAFDLFSPEGVKIRIVYKSQREQTLSTGFKVAYQSADSLRYGDCGVLLYYGELCVECPVSVRKASYDLSSVSFSSQSFVYDGRYKTLDLSDFSVVGRDKLPLTARAVGGGCDAGEYTVTVSFLSDSRNYEIPKDMTVTMTVIALEVSLYAESASFVYNGEPMLPRAFYIDVFGTKRYARLSGSAVSAGEHTASALPEKNYVFSDGLVKFEIKKAQYDLSGVKWSEGGFVYDGLEHSVYLSGLPSGVYVIGYSGERAINAGSYTAAAELSYDEKNYERPKVPECTYVIEKADFDLGGFSFESASAVYDGLEHYPELVGRLPDGLSCKFSAGAVHVAEGSVAVTIELISENGNYNNPGKLVRYVSITPRPIEIIWKIGDYSYYGGANIPEAYADECSLSVSVAGDGIHAGEHTATAVSLNSDYIPKDASCSYSVKKGENFFKSELAVKDSISLLHSPRAEAKYGDVRIVYYSDKDGKNEIERPRREGIYYARAIVDEGDDHLSVMGDIVSFEIKSSLPLLLSLFLILLLLCLLIFAFIKRDAILDLYAIILCRLKNSKRRELVFSESEGAQRSILPEPSAEERAQIKEEQEEDTEREERKTPLDVSESEEDACEEEKEQTEDENDEEMTTNIDINRADMLITDALAKDLLRRSELPIITGGSEREVINIDTLSDSFSRGDRIDINILKERGLIPRDTLYLKVLARGTLNKPLSVYANDFSLAAVKMIALCGGEAIKTPTERDRGEK